jgi:phosphate starvation-inducible PhoH-like protein
MKMFLTRLGAGSKMVITGDPSQSDLPDVRKSGLGEAIRILGNINGIRIVKLTDRDIVRHPLVREIIKAYDNGNTK